MSSIQYEARNPVPPLFYNYSFRIYSLVGIYHLVVQFTAKQKLMPMYMTFAKWII